MKQARASADLAEEDPVGCSPPQKPAAGTLVAPAHLSHQKQKVTDAAAAGA